MGTSRLWPALPTSDLISAEQITNLRNITLRGNMRSLNWDGAGNLTDGISIFDGIDPDATRGFLIDATEGAAHFAGAMTIGSLGPNRQALYFAEDGGIQLFVHEDEVTLTDGRSAQIALLFPFDGPVHAAGLEILAPVAEAVSNFTPALYMLRPSADSDTTAFELTSATQGAGGGTDFWPVFANIESPNLGGTAVALRVRNISAGDIQRWVNAAGSVVAAIDAGGATVATDFGWRKARAQDLTGSGVSTTEAVELTATLDIPTTWNTYDIEAELTSDVRETGTLTGARAVTGRLRLTNVAGTLLGQSTVVLDDTLTLPRASLPVDGYLTGQTATGNVPVVATSQISNDSGQVTISNLTLRATALRTS